jgi:hypothetical protein
LNPVDPQNATQPPAAPPKKGKALKILLIVGGLLVLLCGGGIVACTALVGKAAEDISTELNADQTDVTITGCKLKNNDVLTTVEVSWTVKNSGDNKRTYLPMFLVDSEDGTRLGEFPDSVADLAAGQSAKKRTSVPLDKPFTGKVKCSLSK